jgi:SAM-dependent methyltransferase
MMHALLARAAHGATPGRLLDVGCGGGHFMVAAAAHGWRAFGADLSREASVTARRTAGARVVQADAEALPFRTGALDAVALVNVLDHTTRPLAVVREAARVLRPGGLVVVRLPNGGVHAPVARLLGRLGPAVRWLGWDAYPILHVFAFGPGALGRLIQRADFEVIAMVNSSLASLAPEHAGSRPAALARAALRALTRGGAAALSAVSRGRWLVGPSIEVYARRRGAPE